MHLVILVEDRSTEAALSTLVPKIVPGCTFQLHPHQGKSDLIGRLPAKLKGYAKSLPKDWRIIVVIDQDRSDCVALKKQILAMGERAKLPSSLLCRIAVEELEAWFLGDPAAIATAYPGVRRDFGAKKRFRDPDAIQGGTWEALEYLLKEAGHFPSGLTKIAAARTIAAHMTVDANVSRSFQVFREGLRRLMAEGGKSLPDPPDRRR